MVLFHSRRWFKQKIKERVRIKSTHFGVLLAYKMEDSEVTKLLSSSHSAAIHDHAAFNAAPLAMPALC